MKSFIRNEIRASDLEDTQHCHSDIHRHDMRLRNDAYRKRNPINFPTSPGKRKQSVSNFELINVFEI